jgi:hypothetical protein
MSASALRPAGGAHFGATASRKYCLSIIVAPFTPRFVRGVGAVADGLTLAAGASEGTRRCELAEAAV